jgi:glucose-6-phosphate isomerase
MLTSGISFVNFNKKNKSLRLGRNLQSIINDKNEILNSLSNNYRDSYKKNFVNKYKVFSNYRVIGMGGSILGTRTIYEFLKHKIKKNFSFIDNLQNTLSQSKKKTVNIIVSKSGNTIETIANSNIILKKNNKNIFVTENKKNYLYRLAENLKGEIVHHNNYIGGRYSVLSEVGMLPAELMGLKSKNFRQFNSLMKNKKFLNSLINNVGSILYYIKNQKFNSIIINYDEKSESLFKWYQQLVAESLGKKKKGLLPIVSNMPKDNHSVMQLYLDGFQNNFYTFFYVDEKKSKKLNNKIILPSHKFLKNKSISKIIYSQKKASENIFLKKNIPFRSFEVKKRDEKTLGELFSFFILETILLGKALKLNPYDQPAVELIKKETKKILT